jgi:F-type H+-transporting ATPase subunit c
MRKLTSLLVLAVAALLLAPAAFAQEGGTAPAAGSASWIALAGAFGMALAAAFCGYAQSRAAAAACEGIARNPSAEKDIRAAMFLGLVFIETQALFTLVVVFTILLK